MFILEIFVSYCRCLRHAHFGGPWYHTSMRSTVLKLMLVNPLSVPSNATNPTERSRYGKRHLLRTPELIFSDLSFPLRHPRVALELCARCALRWYLTIPHDVTHMHYLRPGYRRTGGGEVHLLEWNLSSRLHDGLAPRREDHAEEVVGGNNVSVGMSTCRFLDHVAMLSNKALYVKLTAKIAQYRVHEVWLRNSGPLPTSFVHA